MAWDGSKSWNYGPTAGEDQGGWGGATEHARNFSAVAGGTAKHPIPESSKASVSGDRTRVENENTLLPGWAMTSLHKRNCSMVSMRWHTETVPIVPLLLVPLRFCRMPPAYLRFPADSL